MTPRPVAVTISVEFPAAHRLAQADRDAAWNESTYGACARPNGHGHNYRLEVTASGPVDPTTGFAIDGRELRRVVDEAIVSPCAHRRLDLDVDFLRDINPTAENLVAAFAARLDARFAPRVLSSLVLHETERNRAVWVRPKASA